MEEQKVEVIQPNLPNPTPESAKKKPILPKVVILLVLVLALAVAGLYLGGFFNKFISKPCSTEAMICPDGTSVGRVGPNCEFAPCPNQALSSPPTVDETTGWKTYWDEENKLEFKYPTYLIQKGSREYEDSAEISFEDENKSTYLTLRNIGNNTLTGKPFSSFAEVCPQCDEIGFLMRSFNNIGVAQYENTAFFFSKDKSIVFELILSRDPFEESIALLDQILPTLKFLN